MGHSKEIESEREREEILRLVEVAGFDTISPSNFIDETSDQTTFFKTDYPPETGKQEERKGSASRGRKAAPSHFSHNCGASGRPLHPKSHDLSATVDF